MIPKEKFLNLLERELKMLSDGVESSRGRFLGPKLSRKGGKLVVDLLFSDGNADTFYVSKDLESLESFWLRDVKIEWGVKSAEELELLLESRGF